MRLQNFYFFMITAVLLPGCMVGPDFHSATPPKTHSYTEMPAPTKTVSVPQAGAAGQSQYFMAGENIPAEWWTLFRSPAINGLIRKGITNSPNIVAAQATLRQAQETLSAQTSSSLFPALSAQAGGERQRFSQASIGDQNQSSIFNLYNASVNVSYTLDAFGGLRRGIEALAAQVDYQQYQLQAAYLTLTSNIVTTAITAASLKKQIKATYELIHLQEDTLRIVKQQFQIGSAAKTDVLSQQSQLAQTRASLPPLAQSYAQAVHALSVLIGELPSEARLPSLDFEQIHLPTRLPISVPSLLVRQRPDIRASEALLHAASAQVGVATANLYPQINLTGSYGWQNVTIAHMINPANVIWNYGGSVLQSIFDFGTLRAKKRAAIAAYDQAVAQYRQTVLQAFQNVADTLRALENDAKSLRDQVIAEKAAHDALIITQDQYRVGGVSYLSLLTAQRQYQQARISRIQAQASRYSDTAALFQALGGGWWTKNRSGEST